MIRHNETYPIDKTMIPPLRDKFPRLFTIATTIFGRENLLALLIALILIAIYITTAADAPIWLYQGF
jgi:hypothetical protein